MAKPKILYIDIETAPNLGYTWGVWQQNVIAIKEPWYIISFAAKWAGGKMICRGLCDMSGYVKGRDGEDLLLMEIHALLDEADIVVGHNARSFDVKKINARLIDWGFSPPSPYKVVCTKADLKKVATFASHKLDWLSKQFDLGAKLPHQGFAMWEGVMAGDKAAWKMMLKYNRHDVVLLEKLYKKIAAWIPQPNANLWVDEDRPSVCTNPVCGSTRIRSKGIQVRANTRSYRAYRCMECGKTSRGTRAVGTSDLVQAR